MRATFFTVVALGLSPAATLAQSRTLDEIDRAWADRERRLVSGVVEWSERTLHPRGSLSRAEYGERVVPEQDTTIAATKSFVWDGDRMSYRHRGETPSVDGSTFVPDDQRSVVGGGAGSRMLRENPSVGYPKGMILPPADLENREDIDLVPLLLWARPRDGRGCGIEVGRCRLRPDRPIIEGRPCAVLERRRPGGHSVTRWYVDTGRDCLVLRQEVEVGGKTKARIDLSYEHAGDLGFVPSGWRTLWFDGQGALRWDRTATVVARDLAARPGDDEFDLAFPEGTWVHDRVRNVNFIVTPGGGERVVADAEIARGATYQNLLTSEPGLAGLPSPPRWREWVLGVAAATLVASLAAAVVKKARRLGHSS